MVCHERVKHSLQDTLSLICRGGIEVETIIQYQLHCPNYLHKSRTLFDNIKSVLPNILEQNDSFIVMIFSLVIPLLKAVQ